MPGTGTLMLRTRTPRSLLCPVQIRSLEEQCTSQDFTGGRGSLCEWDIDKLEHIQGNRGWSISGPLSNHEVQNLKASRQGEFRVWRMSYSGLARTLSLHILLTTSLASQRTCFSSILCDSRRGFYLQYSDLQPQGQTCDLNQANQSPTLGFLSFPPWKEVKVCVCKDGGTQIPRHLEEVEMVEQNTNRRQAEKWRGGVPGSSQPWGELYPCHPTVGLQEAITVGLS